WMYFWTSGSPLVSRLAVPLEERAGESAAGFAAGLDAPPATPSDGAHVVLAAERASSWDELLSPPVAVARHAQRARREARHAETSRERASMAPSITAPARGPGKNRASSTALLERERADPAQPRDAGQVIERREQGHERVHDAQLRGGEGLR